MIFLQYVGLVYILNEDLCIAREYWVVLEWDLRTYISKDLEVLLKPSLFLALLAADLIIYCVCSFFII